MVGKKNEKQPKVTKVKKTSSAVSEQELEKELDSIEKVQELSETQQGHDIQASRPLAEVSKGNVVIIDGKRYNVDAHYVLIDHGTTKEMTIELFDDSDRDYQLRYFNDQIETTLEFYELQEIMYVKKPFKTISW